MNYQIGQHVQIINVTDAEGAYFKNGATGVIVDVYSGFVFVDFSESDPALYTTGQDGNKIWVVDNTQIQIIS
jgi:hypothetical protein